MTRESTSLRRVCVVGSGVAGLAGAVELAARGVAVDVISSAPPPRSGGVLFRDGISAALSEGDAKDGPAVHAADLAAAASSKAAVPVLHDMAAQAPVIVALLERMGVPFDRTPEGLLATHPTPGSSIARSVGAGCLTGHHVLAALDEQLRRLEHELVRDARGATVPGEPLVRRMVPFELVALVRDDAGVVVGVVAQDLRSMTVTALPYDAVLLATGDFAGLFADTAGSPASVGSGLSVALAEGATLVNVDVTFRYPLAFAGPSKLAALPESLRAQRARIFAAKTPAPGSDIGSLPERERVYITPLADLATPPAASQVVRAIAEAQAKHGAVYVDLSHKKSDQALCARYGDIALLCERWTGKGLFDGPLAVRPAVARTLGGLFVDHELMEGGGLRSDSVRSQATSLPGLYAAGGAAGAPFSARACAADLLLGDLHAGRLAAEGVIAYRSAMAKSAFDLPKSLFDGAQKRADEAYASLLERGQGDREAEDARAIHADLRELMRKLGPRVEPTDYAQADGVIDALEERASRAKSFDTAGYANPEVPFLRRLGLSLSLGRAAFASARARADEGGEGRRVFMQKRDGALEVVRAVAYAAAGKAVRVSDDVPSAEAISDG